MISSIISRLVILVFGTLYPAYASYKAVRTKNLKEYVKWMMYWIVFALFTCTETFTDVFLSWFPFYYEVKIVLVLWLLSPATKGSSILYRKFVHPALCRREQEIDEYIAKAKDQGYHTVLNLGTKGVNYATTVIMQTAIKGGGGLVQQLRKSYSLSDLSECEPREERGGDEADDVMTEPRVIRRVAKSVYNTRRSASESNSRSPMYFPEVDVDLRSARSSRSDEPDFSHIKSTEDISSGYSSADNSASLTRTASVGAAAARAKARTTRTTVTTIKRPQAAEENEVIIEELHDDDTFDYANMPPLVNLPSPLYLSHTDPPFLYHHVGDQIKIIQVLGNYAVPANNNETNNSDRQDQKEATGKESISMMDLIKEELKNNPVHKIETTRTEDPQIIINNELTIIPEIHQDDETVNKDYIETAIETENTDNIVENSNIPNVTEDEFDNPEATELKLPLGPTNNDYTEITKTEMEYISDDRIESTSMDTSPNDNDSSDCDDEASFGTPDNSPKSKRRSPKGKYGKGKAPLPPNLDDIDKTYNDKDATDKPLATAVSTTSQESLSDIVNKLPNTAFKESGTFKGLRVVNPIAEKKRRNKSKSPGRHSKGNSSGIGKLLQLPGKLAFWNKTDDKSKDTVSTSSGDRSRSSSTIEKNNDGFQSCSNLDSLTDDDNIIDKPHKAIDDVISFQDATDLDPEDISQDIMEKSDALQKLIEAKLESHPEYKYVSLHEEIPTASKSTDV